MTIGKTLGAASLAALLMTSAVHAQKAPKPGAYNETPAKLVESTEGFDFERRDVMIPMRDGVKLHTVILVPKGAKRAPILLTRTPYNATELTSHAASGTLAAVLQGYDNATDVIVEGGYIRVVQDVRGKYGSEGDYVMNRPLQGPLNPTKVDHATDTYDTIDWLVKNIAETNGKVGILGISYDGFLPLMALVNPHPALKVSVPMNPMVDGWMGDDWFHHGAFRQQNLPYIWEQQATRDNSAKWWSNTHDDYDLYLRAGSAGELARQRGLDQVGFWRKIIEHPAYDAFWQEQAMDKVLAKQPLKVPVMLVHGLWDQEDIYGAPAVYKALKPLDTAGDKVFLAMGPWFHGQQIEDGSTLGAIKWDADTAKQFRHEVLAPFLARYLKDDAPAADIAPVNAFETGTNTWRKLTSWPLSCETCAAKPQALYLQAGGKLSFSPPAGDGTAYDEYVSDPAKPVPNRARPSQPVGYDPPFTLDPVAGRRPARELGPHRRPDLHHRCIDSPGADLRRATGQSDRLDQRYRQRLGRQADRCLSGYGSGPAGHGRLSTGGVDGHFPRPISRKLQRSQGHHAGQAPALSFRPADHEPCVQAGSPDHGAGAVQLVPALRPQTRRPSCRTSSSPSRPTT